MKFKSIICGLFAFAAVVACKQDEPVVEPALEVTPATASVKAEGGEVALKVTSNVNWTAVSDSDWATVDTPSGKGSENAAEVKVSVGENKTEAARTAVVTVATETLKKTVKITQAAPQGEEPAPEPPVEPNPVENSWGMMGMFVDNEWKSDIPMTTEGEWIVAKGAQFTELTFKIRANASWADATNIGVAPGSERGVVNGKVAVVTAEYSKANLGGDAADIKLNGEAGTYDVYFSFENLEVYVMEQGYKPGEKEPQNPEPVEVTYTVTGTIKDHPWENNYDGGLMVAEEGYLVARNVPLVWNSTCYGGDYNRIEFKIVETGTWNGYAYPEKNIDQQANAEFTVQIGGENIAVDAPEGNYDIYFDKANMKVWVMTAGLKPGETPENPEVPEAFAAGEYWIMGTKDGATKVMTPLAEDKKYGYASSEEAIDGASYAANIFTIAAVEGGYTISDASGRYYYQEAGTTYKTFNVGTDASLAGCVWTISAQDDGTYAVVNAASGKTIRYAEGSYTSFGVYSDDEANGSVLINLVKAENPVEPEVPEVVELAHPQTSNVPWILGDNAYDENHASSPQSATINGVSITSMLKLGTSKLAGEATIVLPAGTTKVGFYAASWKNSEVTLVASWGTTPIATINPPANDGASGNPTYTITATDEANYFELDVKALFGGKALDQQYSYTLTTSGTNTRVILWGINYYTEDGIGEPYEPVFATPEGKQWMTNVTVGDATLPAVVDLGATTPGTVVLAVDGTAFGAAGVYVNQMEGTYTVEATDASSGKLTLVAGENTVETSYSEFTENSVKLDASALGYGVLECTLVSENVTIVKQ